MGAGLRCWSMTSQQSIGKTESVSAFLFVPADPRQGVCLLIGRARASHGTASRGRRLHLRLRPTVGFRHARHKARIHRAQEPVAKRVPATNAHRQTLGILQCHTTDVLLQDLAPLPVS